MKTASQNHVNEEEVQQLSYMWTWADKSLLAAYLEVAIQQVTNWLLNRAASLRPLQNEINTKKVDVTRRCKPMRQRRRLRRLEVDEASCKIEITCQARPDVMVLSSTLPARTPQKA